MSVIWRCRGSRISKKPRPLTVTPPPSDPIKVKWAELTVDELSRVVEEVGHEHPVDDHGSDQRHHGEDQAGPLATLAKVVPANIREFPVGRVHIRWTETWRQQTITNTFQTNMYRLENNQCLLTY